MKQIHTILCAFLIVNSLLININLCYGIIIIDMLDREHVESQKFLVNGYFKIRFEGPRGVREY